MRKSTLFIFEEERRVKTSTLSKTAEVSESSTLSERECLVGTGALSEREDG